MKYTFGGVLVVIVIVLTAAALLTTNKKSTAPLVLANDLTELPDHELEQVQPTEIVELKDGDTFDLTASVVQQEVGNRMVKRLAYNGQIPGPIIKVEKGAKVTIRFTNNIDMETALHSHGIRGDWRFDGATPITEPVGIGETFSYELEFPDEGVYWYHPHVREDYQQELGLYGNMIVDGAEDYWNSVDQEEYLIFDDVLEDGDFVRDAVTYTLMGRFGDTLLINDQEDYQVQVDQGAITRLFVTNVANTRTFDLSFPNARVKLVGGDNGRIEHEIIVDDIIMGPAERYVVELYYDKPGTYPIMHRGTKMGEVVVSASTKDRSAAFAQLRSNSNDYASLRGQFADLLTRSPDKNIRLAITMRGMMMDMMEDFEAEGGSMMGGNRSGMGMMGGTSGERSMMGERVFEEHGAEGIEWEDEMVMMNARSTDDLIEWIIEDRDTRKQNDAIDWTFKQGDQVKIRIYNDPNTPHAMQHPIHFHGQRFVVLSRDGEPNDNLQWKDTALIRTGETVDILVDMSNPGKWMAHCHIAEHLHAGMMFMFDVVE